MRYFLFLALCVVLVSSSPYCSAWCKRGWDGLSLTNQCTDDTSATCTSCDSPIFYWDATDSKCHVNTTLYKHQLTLLDSSTQFGLWTTNTGIGTSSQTDGFYSYQVYTFNGVTNMTYTTSLVANHSSIRLKMFLYVPVANNFGNLTFVINGINTQYKVNTSFLKYLEAGGDYYLYTTPEIPHSGTSLLLSIFSEGLIGGSFNFGIKQLMVFTNKCPTSCKDCMFNNSVVICTQCVINKILYKGKCISQCPAGTYFSSDDCLPCNQSCATCQSAGRCTTCSQSFSATRFLMKNGTCGSVCPQKTFEVYGSFVCSPCATGCLTCNGDQNQDCTSCTIDDLGYTYLLSANGEGCQIQCPLGQLHITLSSFPKCSYCDALCRTCSGIPSNCTSCYPTNSTHFSSIFYNNSCSTDCPNNYISAHGTCMCPSVGFYEQELGVCASCHYSCTTCFDNTSSGCNSCNPGYYLLVNTSICQSMCPTGQYISVTENQCISCSKQCIACNGNSFNCTVCSNTTYLLNFTCHIVCPPGYQGVKFPNVCRRCSVETFSYNNTCVNICPPLHKVDDDINACVEFIQVQDPSVFDFTIIPSFINNGAQLCLQLLFKTKLMLLHNADTKVSVFMTTSASKRLLSLSSQVLNITNVDIDQSLLNIKIFTDVPELFRTSTQNSNDQIIIHFKNSSLLSQNGTLMTQYKSLPTKDPSFIRQIYNSFYSSPLEAIGMVFSIIGILLIPFSYFKKFTYYPIIEFLLQLQLMRLIGFTLYPVKYETFIFLKGFDVAQFQWMPNIVNALTLSIFGQNSFAAYQFKSSTMNFLSLSASNLLFILIFQPILGYLYLYDKNKFSKFILWSQKTLIYICSTNILFAAISSFVSLFINTQNLSLLFIISQLLGLTAIAGIVYFFIIQRKQFRKYKMFFVTSLAFCVLVPFFSKSFSVCFVLLNIAQVGIIVATYKNRKKSDKRTKPLMIGRILFLIMFNFIELGYYPILVVVIGSLFFAAELGIIGYIIYLSFIKKKLSSERKEMVKHIEIKDQVKQVPFPIQEQFTKQQIVRFSDDKPEDLMYYDEEQQISERSPRKKVEGRKDSLTYYSPRKNWRSYNNNKSKTIYKQEQLASKQQSNRSKVSGTHLSINPFGVEENHRQV